MIRCIVLGILVLTVVGYFAYCLIDDALEGNSDHCLCTGYDCGCCAQLKMGSAIDGKVCANFTYLPEPDYGIRFDMFYNNKRKIEYEISLRNPPKICFDDPIYIDDAAVDFCLDFYDVNIENQHFSGCLDLEFRFLNFNIKRIKLGCFGSRASPSIATDLKDMYYYVTGTSKFNDTDVTLVVLK